MAAALERQKRSRDWTKEGGQFVPYPATWLNQRRWEDEDEPPTSGPPDPGGRVVETEEVLYL